MNMNIEVLQRVWWRRTFLARVDKNFILERASCEFQDAPDGTLIRRCSRQVENFFKKIYSLMGVVMPSLHIEYEIC